MEPWSGVARVYDWQLPLERHALRTVVGMLAIQESEALLDVGTGTGAVLREVERLPAQPARAVGVDNSDRMLARARAALRSGGELLRADAAALPFADASFDVVTCAYLLHLLPIEARAETLRELHRVLEPGGRLGIVTVAPPVGRLARLLSSPVRAAAGRSTGVLGGLLPLDPTDELESAGFEVEAACRAFVGYPSLCIRARRC